LGTSPVLHDDELDVTIWESGAIIDYLLELYDTEHKLHPPPPPPPPSPSNMCPAGDPAKIVAQQQQARAKYLQLKQFIIATVYPFVASWYIHSLKTDAAAAEQDVAYLESAQHKWRTVLAPVLVDWLGDGPYFLGDQMTVASLLVAKQLTNIHALGILPEFPTLQAFFDRVSSRPSYRPAYDYGLLQRAAAAATEQSPASATSSLPHHQTLVLVPSSSMRTATMP
jgi:glutathione S-transferase